MDSQPLNIDEVREQLDSQSGPEFWRSLNEVADSPRFRDHLEHEFPEGTDTWEDGPSRRTFLKLAGASMALAGLTACARQPQEKIVPFVKQPEYMVPGKSVRFATALTMGGYAAGVVATSYEGRPTKCDGNPNHPANLGASDIYTQAAILDMYDPDRTQGISYLGSIKPWQVFADEMAALLEAQRGKRGSGIRILTGNVTSPTLADQLTTLSYDFPDMKWHQYEPVNRDNAVAGAEMAFGQNVNAIYKLDQADVILSLDSDFLTYGPAAVRYARDFISKRHVDDYGGNETDAELNRMYAVEATPTLTGAMADHRLSLAPSKVAQFARALASELGIEVGAVDMNVFGNDQATVEMWIDVLAEEFRANEGHVAVVAGNEQPALVHALAHAIMARTDSVGTTVQYTEPIEAEPTMHTASLIELVDDINAGEVDILFVLGTNPVYDAPADIDFAGAMDNIGTVVYNGLSIDETANRSHWIIPGCHELESWSDARAYDGTISIIQPLIEPIWNGKTHHEVIAAALGTPEKRTHDIVKDYWLGRTGMGEDRGAFEKWWKQTLAKGVVEETAAFAMDVEAKSDYSDRDAWQPEGNDLEVVFRPDPMVYDGRFANNGWLQELPKPIFKHTWTNAVIMHPDTVSGLGLHNEDVVELTLNDTTVQAPVLAQPGHPRDSMTLHLGYGRTHAGRIGNGVGFNANQLRTSANPWMAQGAELQQVGHEWIATTDEHYAIDYGYERGMSTVMEQAKKRHVLRVASAEEYNENPSIAHEGAHVPDEDQTFFPASPWDGAKWGMSIDLNRCTGCSACVAACNAENNIPVVGKEQVVLGREMHWIRVDRYYRGDFDNPEFHHQPVPCMQCENAPCELVCPVAATVHSHEGLNDMVYNRCVGTRYCSNNCPYKVRRFNFLHFAKLQYGGGDYESLELGRNPNVTVRSRGVMEKCTYCVQRISAARIEAKKRMTTGDNGSGENGPVDAANDYIGPIETACQQACPTAAIQFGDLRNGEAEVVKAKQSPRNYALLADLNTRPRTTYLAKVTNPNPRLLKG